MVESYAQRMGNKMKRGIKQKKEARKKCKIISDNKFNEIIKD